MKSCKEISILTEKSQFEKLSFKDKWSLWFHMVICKLCKNYTKESRALNGALKRQKNITTTLTQIEKEHIQQGLSK